MFKKIFFFIFLIACFFSCKQAPSISTEKSGQQTTVSAHDLVYKPQDIRYFISAHRGGKGYMGYPENCLETMQFLIDEGIQVFEIDIATTKDDQLVLMHDDQLNRTSTGTGNISDYRYEELKQVELVDDYQKSTHFTIPLLHDVLLLAKEKGAVLMLDFKKSVPYQKVIDLVRETATEGHVVLISYNQNQAEKLHRLAPEMMLSVSIRNQEEYKRHAEKGIPDHKMVAFVGVSEPSKEHYHFLHQKGIMTILGTLGNLDKRAATRGDQIYRQFFQNGADILSSDRAVESQKVIFSLNP